jgi:hypothetical protein
MTNLTKKLSDLEPTPKSGEWYSICIQENESEIRIPILIKEGSDTVELPYGFDSELNESCNPLPLTKVEACNLLMSCIFFVELDLTSNEIKKIDKVWEEWILEQLKSFYLKHFVKSEEELIKEFAKAKAQEKIGFILFENEGIFIFDPKNKIFMGTHLENYSEQKFNWLKEGLKEYLEENLSSIPEKFRKALTYRINDFELNFLIKKLIKK